MLCEGCSKYDSVQKSVVSIRPGVRMQGVVDCTTTQIDATRRENLHMYPVPQVRYLYGDVRSVGACVV